MIQFAPLTPQRHGNKGLSPIRSYLFAAPASLVPIAVTEFGSVASSMPIAFIQEEGHYSAVAVLSLIGGRNFFVSPGNQWLGRYVPIVFRAYPFRLLRRDPGSEDYVLCIDEACPELTEAGGDAQPLYTAEGKLAPMVEVVTDLLQRYERGRLLAGKALAALAEASIICPWEVKVKLADGEQTARGLHRIDETALGRLGDKAFLALRKSAALPVAYAQLLSMAQFEVLQRLAGMQTELARSPSSPAGTSGGIFLANDESLHFG